MKGKPIEHRIYNMGQRLPEAIEIDGRLSYDMNLRELIVVCNSMNENVCFRFGLSPVVRLVPCHKDCQGSRDVVHLSTS